MYISCYILEVYIITFKLNFQHSFFSKNNFKKIPFLYTFPCFSIHSPFSLGIFLRAFLFDLFFYICHRYSVLKASFVNIQSKNFPPRQTQIIASFVFLLFFHCLFLFLSSLFCSMQLPIKADIADQKKVVNNFFFSVHVFLCMHLMLSG